MAASLHCRGFYRKRKYHVSAHKSDRETTIPGAAHRPVWRMTSTAEWLDLFSEDFDRLPNSSGFEKFPIIPCSTESKLK